MIDGILTFGLGDAIVIAVCFLGGIVSTSIGTSGGITFAAMASFYPVSVVVPIHAAVETTASIFRSYLLRNYIDWRFFFSFVGYGVLGILLALPFVGAIPEDLLQLALGLFILAITWLPIQRLLSHTAHTARAGGLVTSFLTIFVGATGPLVAAIIAKRFSDHPRVIATHAICMSAQHAAKIAVFVSIGWSITAFASKIIAMIIATGFGTWIGRYIILSGPRSLIKGIFKAAVTLLGLQIIGDAIVGRMI